MASGTDSFDDADDLSATQDQRALDTFQLSRTSDALALISAFRSATPGPAPIAPGQTHAPSMPIKSPWTHLDRGNVADGLIQLLSNPRWIRQSGLPLCGPCAFFNIVAGRHPVALARAATSLFDTGKCLLGSLTIQPSTDLLNADFGAIATKIGDAQVSASWQAAWMLISSIKNVTKEFWQVFTPFLGDGASQIDQFAGISPPGEVEGWFKGTGFFTTVNNHASWNTCQGIPHAEGLYPCPVGTDVAMLINANLLYTAGVFGAPVEHGLLMRSIATHWVILVSEVVSDNTNNVVHFSVWSWGDTSIGLSVPSQVFLQNYYGAITTKIRS